MSRKKSIWLWIFAIVFTLCIAIFQRMTGPTYPVSGKITLHGNAIKFKLPRSSDADAGELIKIEIPDTTVRGAFTFKRFKSNDSLTTVTMKRDGCFLTALVPKQPPAGKVMYKIMLTSGNETTSLSDDFVVLRYKGKVPAAIWISHVILIFLAMLYSTRTGIEGMYNGIKTYRYAFVTLVTLFISGLILGPVMQKYAFGAYWTGWPFGHDLTDNKTLVAFVFWAIAFFKLSRNRKNYKWAIIAAVILLVVFLIPHSMLGSEIDYTAK